MFFSKEQTAGVDHKNVWSVTKTWSPSLQEVEGVELQAVCFKFPDIYDASLHLKMDGWNTILYPFGGPLLNAYSQGQTCC